MAGTSDETFEIASEHLASRMRWRSHSWLCLIGAVLWLALWILIEERIEQGAAWTSPLAGMGPLPGAALVTVFLVIAVVPTLIGLSGVLGAVSVPPPTPFLALLAVRRLPLARALVALGLLGTVAVPPLILLGLLGTVAVPPLILLGLERTRVLPLMALPMLLVVVVPAVASWIRARSGALTVARREDGTFRLLRWEQGRAVPASHGVDGLLGVELTRRGVHWRPGAEAAVHRWTKQARLHPTEEEIRTLTLPWSWAGQSGEGRAHPHERAGHLAYGTAILCVVGFMLLTGTAVVVHAVPDGNRLGAAAGALLAALGVLVAIQFVRGSGSSH
ncbi:hypothetical protein [Brachybacterium sp. p3-SID957]|uniref:hypothetical protein n=1 Tax=Brachybacterium sp. p3-SID957 TaxID=2916049 RepID=UPI00223AC0F0|nr:hypothetical protein [Brachybacterium sp. p3-SID957]MCT1776614.1 hypothetical protein [Brachybacterium sp. p3-SID957]